MTRVFTLPMSCSSADQRTIGLGHRLQHHLLGVLPDVLVPAPALLREVDGRVELGQHRPQHARVVHPLQAGAERLAHDDLLDPCARSCAAGSATISGAAARAAVVIAGSGSATPPAIGGQIQHARRLGAERRAPLFRDIEDLDRQRQRRYDVIFLLS